MHSTLPNTLPNTLQKTAPLELHIEPEHTQTTKITGRKQTRAFIALSQGVEATFYQHQQQVSFTRLSHLGFSPLKAWDAAAAQAIHRARTHLGIAIQHRDASALLPDLPGVQLRIQDSKACSWLAHPRTFQVVHQHAQKLLGGSVHYLAIDQDTLVAYPTQHTRTMIYEFLCTQHDPFTASPIITSSSITSPIISSPLAYHNGFPVLLRGEQL